MNGRDSDNERAIVVAFLKSGHPRLAFATVAMRWATRLALMLCLAGGGYFAAGRTPEFAAGVLSALGWGQPGP